MKNYPDAIETGKEGLRLSQFYKELMVSTGSLKLNMAMPMKVSNY